MNDKKASDTLKDLIQPDAVAQTENYPKWRSVEADPPPQYEGVLVSDGCVFGVALQTEPGEWQDSNTGEPLAYATIGAMEQWLPTHWMPLPENP